MIISQFPPSSGNLSLRAALTSDTHPSTQQFSRSSFPPKLEFLLLQLPVPLNSKGHMASIFLPSLSCTPKASSLQRETEQNLSDMKATPEGTRAEPGKGEETPAFRGALEGCEAALHTDHSPTGQGFSGRGTEETGFAKSRDSQEPHPPTSQPPPSPDTLTDSSTPTHGPSQPSSAVSDLPHIVFLITQASPPTKPCAHTHTITRIFFP